MDYNSLQKIARHHPGPLKSGDIMRKRNSRAPKLDCQRFFLTSGWKHAALCFLFLALWGLPLRAQMKTRADIGPSSGENCPTTDVCASQPVGYLPPLVPKAVPDDEKCLPWNLSVSRAATTSVTKLKVPSKARDEYVKACNASHEKNFEESERHLRRAIDRFSDYSAAWVLLGVVLDEQHKAQEARDACSHATTIDGKYLPAYLCAAEFASRNQEWQRLLDLANAALGLSSENKGYAYFYQATADYYLNNLADARKSALQAAESDVNHNYLPLYFLLAQIHDAEGDKIAAENQLREILNHQIDPEQEEVVKKYLARLEAGEAAKAAQKSAAASKSAAAETLTDWPEDWTTAAMGEPRKPNEKWIPEDIDQAVPPVASGVVCSLPVVLKGASQRIVELVHNVDRFTATEVLMHQPVDHSGHMGPATTAKFSYLVSYTENSTGYFHVDELRNGGPSVESFPNHIATLGTPSLILIFHPRYINNFRMECEGLGDWHGQPAWQVRFEQRADRPNLTYAFTINRSTHSVNLRGRAWILAGSYQVARLETDLKQSIPELRLRLDHQSIEYRPVESASKKLQLWLPSSAEIYMEYQGHRFFRKHSFTDFTIFSVDTKYDVKNPKETPAEQ
jgi:hypothetical protein